MLVEIGTAQRLPAASFGARIPWPVEDVRSRPPTMSMLIGSAEQASGGRELPDRGSHIRQSDQGSVPA